jgi:hypothetical protein
MPVRIAIRNTVAREPRADGAGIGATEKGRARSVSLTLDPIDSLG